MYRRDVASTSPSPKRESWRPLDGVVDDRGRPDGFGARLDVPALEGAPEEAGDIASEQGLAGARLTFDQEGATQRDGDVDRARELG
jgi:hypothetical protein